MKSTIKAFSTIALTMLLLSFAVTFAGPVSAADPSVFIAVDTTTPTCVLHYARGIGTTHVTHSDIPCGPGNNIATKEIKLSQALAAREKYVVVPPKSATSEVVEKANNAVREMMQAKSAAIRAKSNPSKSNAIHPNNTACGQSNSVSIPPGWGSGNDDIEGTLYYSISADCQAAYLQYFEIRQLSTIDSDGHGLDKMLYGNSSWDPNCPNLLRYYPNNFTYNLYTSKTAGLDFVVYVASGSACGLSFKNSIGLPVN